MAFTFPHGFWCIGAPQHGVLYPTGCIVVPGPFYTASTKQCELPVSQRAFLSDLSDSPKVHAQAQSCAMLQVH